MGQSAQDRPVQTLVEQALDNPGVIDHINQLAEALSRTSLSRSPAPSQQQMQQDETSLLQQQPKTTILRYRMTTGSSSQGSRTSSKTSGIASKRAELAMLAETRAQAALEA